MNYNETRKMIENMATENYGDFIKSIISFERGVNDKEALDKIYDNYTANDSLMLLNEEFDRTIEDLREQGQIKDLPCSKGER